jgi:hypothetical protein
MTIGKPPPTASTYLSISSVSNVEQALVSCHDSVRERCQKSCELHFSSQQVALRETQAFPPDISNLITCLLRDDGPLARRIRKIGGEIRHPCGHSGGMRFIKKKISANVENTSFEMNTANVRGCLYIDEISNHRDGHKDGGQVQLRRAKSKSAGRVSTWAFWKPGPSFLLSRTHTRGQFCL